MNEDNRNYSHLLPHFCSQECADKSYFANKFYGEWTKSHDKCDECGD